MEPFRISLNRSRLLVEHASVPLAGLRPPGSGMRIAHLSDWHVRWLYVDTDELVHTLHKERPNAIVCTGDFVDRYADIQKALHIAKKLADVAPFYTIFGNNDHDGPPAIATRRLRAGLNLAGCTVLCNESVDLAHGSVQLVGVDDALTGNADLDKAFSRVRGDRPVIVLSHSTEILLGRVDERMDLLLAGHTHGGQIRFPLLGPLRGADYYSRRGIFEGWHEIGGVRTYINRGIGCNRMPIRLNCPPTLCVMELRAQDPSSARNSERSARN